jgi:hypothetical protein
MIDYSEETKYRLHIDNMKSEIKHLVDDCFSHKGDPEVEWKFFREQLSHYKREQKLIWLNLDDFE